MSQTVSIITPAYKAERHLAHAVRSVLAQTYEDWEMIVVEDDGQDYAALLAGAGLADERIRFMSSGKLRGGASNARNVVLDVLTTPYVAVLDADDRFKPEKLVRAVAALADQPIVSCALDVMTEDFRPLRLVGAGPDKLHRAGAHKFTCLSMDTMLVWDRRICDARYDLELTNMTDLELLMQLYRFTPTSYHLGTPLHDYIKLTVSMSNGPGVTEKMIRAKTIILERLRAGHYPMADAGAAEGIEAFLRISLEAEKAYPALLEQNPSALFEDNIEPMLRASPYAATL